jgi:mono/diheme cytochrome c family protein
LKLLATRSRLPARTCAVLGSLALAAAVAGDQGSPATAGAAADGAVTAASGPSWVVRRSLNMLDASMGRLGVLGHASEAPSPARLPPWPWPALQERWTLTGADLYRLDCRSCHNADGTGLPPEINSVLDPVRAASAVLLRKRMEERGRPIDAATARQLAGQAEANLRQRLHAGGEKMPALPHITEAEADALLGYLGRLADVPEAAHKDPHLSLSTAQVGQHLVKSTCQICHDATGPGAYSGRYGTGSLIPSLATIVETKSVADVIHKVQTGSPSQQGRGEMPTFPYLSDQEIGAAYLYLVAHPPQADAAR